MSIRLMTAAWAVQLPDSEKLVLLALADCANDEGLCWPSMKSLVTKCSKSDRTIQACIKSLVDKGHLDRHEKPGKGCSYTVHPRSGFAPEAASPPKKVRATPEAASDKPSKNHHSSEPNGSSVVGKRVPKPFELPEGMGIDPQHWDDLLANRKRKRLNNTATAYAGQLRALSELSDEEWPPGRLVQHAAEKGWGAIYDPRSPGSQYVQHRPANDRPDEIQNVRLRAAAQLDAERNRGQRHAGF